MSERFLRPAEVCERYGDAIKVKTLANWRSGGGGPPFIRIGGRILYPMSGLIAWERSRMAHGADGPAKVLPFQKIRVRPKGASRRRSALRLGSAPIQFYRAFRSICRK